MTEILDERKVYKAIYKLMESCPDYEIIKYSETLLQPFFHKYNFVPPTQMLGFKL